MKSLYTAFIGMALLYSCTHKMNSSTGTASPIQFLDSRGNPMLLGVHSEKELHAHPYTEWYAKNYAEYVLDTATANSLKPLLRDKTFEIFMGIWCGDSKREVPRMFKILISSGVALGNIKLIMVDSHDSSYKQSPTHEEKGKDIHRVPDLLVYENGRELGRIVESPIESLEKDLLKIASGSPYEPNYKVVSWLAHQFKTKSIEQLKAEEAEIQNMIRKLSRNSYELNTFGNVLCAAKEMEKAQMVFQWNSILYPKEARVYNGLGDFYLTSGDKEMARLNYKKVLEIDPVNSNAKKNLEKL